MPWYLLIETDSRWHHVPLRRTHPGTETEWVRHSTLKRLAYVEYRPEYLELQWEIWMRCRSDDENSMHLNSFFVKGKSQLLKMSQRHTARRIVGVRGMQHGMYLPVSVSPQSAFENRCAYT
jgi:hypothetical protein